MIPPRLALTKYMEQILFGLNDFLKKHVGITEEMSLKGTGRKIYPKPDCRPSRKKTGRSDSRTHRRDLRPHAVNVASPYFVGHMTAAIPFFMVHLKTIVAALNQNVVKLETSKVVSVLEKQLLAKIHRLIYQQSATFYDTHVQNTRTALGAFTEDGTLANISALWVARNHLLTPQKDVAAVEEEGLHAAFQSRGIDRCVVLVSRLGHYSLQKAGGILGIGNQNVIRIDVDQNNKIKTGELLRAIKTYHGPGKTRVLAVVGIAGTTETGTVDPLPELADMCEAYKIHFHVDAAWGGPTLMSERYAHLLEGIQRADSVTIDGHKQFYMPMCLGMVYFKDPVAMDRIAYHANYVNRLGSVDLGIKSISGSREANSLILDSALKIMGSRGYALLIEHGIETARQFADEITARPDFELVSAPELNILTYRICPQEVKTKLTHADAAGKEKINRRLNAVNQTVQRLQREAGKSFVSRTTLHIDGEDIVVFRSVIMSPMTTISILKEILDEQEEIYRTHFAEFALSQVQTPIH